jgi:hypothetical protein
MKFGLMTFLRFNSRNGLPKICTADARPDALSIAAVRPGPRSTTHGARAATPKTARKRDGERAAFRVLTDVRSRPNPDPQGRP